MLRSVNQGGACAPSTRSSPRHVIRRLNESGDVAFLPVLLNVAICIYSFFIMGLPVFAQRRPPGLYGQKAWEKTDAWTKQWSDLARACGYTHGQWLPEPFFQRHEEVPSVRTMREMITTTETLRMIRDRYNPTRDRFTA